MELTGWSHAQLLIFHSHCKWNCVKVCFWSLWSFWKMEFRPFSQSKINYLIWNPGWRFETNSHLKLNLFHKSMVFATHLRLGISFRMHNNLLHNYLRPYTTGWLGGSHMRPHFIYFGSKATYSKHTNPHILQKADSRNARCKASRLMSIVGHGLLLVEVTRSHSVGILWTSDQPNAETSTWQHTTLTRHKHQYPQRDSNPQSQQASGRRPTLYTARRMGLANWTEFALFVMKLQA